MAWHPLPTLTPSNQRRWFRNMQIALEGKDLFWITRQTKAEFVRSFDEKINLSKECWPLGHVPCNGLDHNLKIDKTNREKYYEVTEIKAFAYRWQGDSLSEEDKDGYDQEECQGERPSFNAFWERLKNKYQEKPSTTKGELGDGEAAPSCTPSPAAVLKLHAEDG
ncbi:hypothetical protein HYALB_00005445 [Hymenoscyphus albidus]|uniref:Uncharacterized protein n=1 Tax=Hymenoscyphus albidus TaxID=595503 RepID=A0A9N9Q1C8_9HELO|nr:hypothetical protein HYALB_00005445 [Hymenoscyphus albidus]